MTQKLSKSLLSILRDKAEFWNGFDRIIVYYDNGQIELTKVLTGVFSTLSAFVEFRKVKPEDYRSPHSRTNMRWLAKESLAVLSIHLTQAFAKSSPVLSGS